MHTVLPLFLDCDRCPRRYLSINKTHSLACDNVLVCLNVHTPDQHQPFTFFVLARMLYIIPCANAYVVVNVHTRQMHIC